MDTPTAPPPPGLDRPSTARAGEVFTAFLKLGLTAFGGPVAHLGYFREEFVTRRRWLDDAAYADLVALCQFLPGPASSQVGLALGLLRAGPAGALAAWLAFTLPSAIVMVLTALGVAAMAGEAGLTLDALSGLKAAAVAVVALALWGMAKTLTPDARRASVAVAAAALVAAWESPLAQIAAIVAGGAAGLALVKPEVRADAVHLPVPVSRRWAVAALAAFVGLLVGLPLVAEGPLAEMFDAMYRSGALVFGGGHVVLPLLQAEVVEPGWVGAESFMAGYGAAQAVPGPLFTFAAYLGTAAAGIVGGLVALAGIFLPAWLLVLGALPFWARLRSSRRARQVLAGVNAAVVGLLAAAFYDPVFTAGVRGPLDFAVALLALLLLAAWKVPPWAVVLVCGALGVAV
ncbi:chromate efflux transporter [Caenispirillum salinarum]|uniref:chromate efflux transporter n=1 Tax=Caenispirillum salinarum TaxID=859058 RepID=UPI00384B4477